MSLPSKYPNTWNTSRFGEIVTIANGQVSPQQKPYDEYYHIGPENIVQNTGQIINLKRSKDLNLISGKYLFDANSIVYSKIRPNLNKVCLPNFTGICSADAYPISPKKDKVTRTYLYHFMLSQLFTKQSIACSMRTGLPKINRQELNAIKVLLPPLPEQKRIAEVLGTWDTGIEALGKLIAAKQKRKKALMQQLLTGKKRFKEFKGEKWETIHLGDVFKERNEIGNAHLPLLAITGANGVVDREDLERRDTSNSDKSKYLRICPGDIGYNTMRMWQGVSGVSDFEGIISPAYTVCIPNKKRVDSHYMGYLFKFHPTIFLFYRYSQGLVSDTWNLKYHHFAEIKVTIPSVKEQQQIASVLNAADKEIELLKKQLGAMKQQKKGLMQKLLTGKVRVKV